MPDKNNNYMPRNELKRIIAEAYSHELGDDVGIYVVFIRAVKESYNLEELCRRLKLHYKVDLTNYKNLIDCINQDV